ncbi:hypothetical protein [Roseospira navarrensis]|uniref:Uncharacterized protein n=1 Tax=Roseospira navarrensis TaxID=140058 RepID=A0A7X1ZCV0_9PROT|nr:hypothetical protein [Roseospira navarrensis]MQX36223.1 hypothetical protein [Roseospira navarrensis]
MMTLSPRTFEGLLADKARVYLSQAHRLDPDTADRVAGEAARQVMAGLRPAAVQQAYPAVIRVARRMTMALPGRGPAGAAPPVPARQGRPMRQQPLDPLTLADLGDRSRSGGRRLVGQLPALRALVSAGAIFAMVLLALPSPTG